MTPRREKRKKEKKDTVRFVLSGPAPSHPLEFSERILLPVNLTFFQRLSAALIAAFFLCAGIALVVPGVRDADWLPGLLGALSVAYGAGWVRAVVEGRLAGGRLRLNPWRRK